MKKLQINFFLVLALLVGLTSCLKKDAMNFDPDNKSVSAVELEYIAGGPGSAIGSGMQYFGGGAVLFPLSDVSDTSTFNVRIAGPALSKDVTISVGADAKAMMDNFANDSINYLPMPTNLYKIVNPTVTIKAGQRFAAVNVAFFPNQIDPLKDYMLPIAVTDAQGTNVSSNFGHIYFHTIGNPLAGVYSWDFTRYNGDTIPSKKSTNFTGKVMSSIPSSHTSMIMGDNYLQTFVDASAGVSISFDNNNGVLSNFKAYFDGATMANLAKNGFTIAVAPKIISYEIKGDLSTHFAGSSFRTYFSLINSGGGTRSMIDNYVKN